MKVTQLVRHTIPGFGDNDLLDIPRLRLLSAEVRYEAIMEIANKDNVLDEQDRPELEAHKKASAAAADDLKVSRQEFVGKKKVAREAAAKAEAQRRRGGNEGEVLALAAVEEAGR